MSARTFATPDEYVAALFHDVGSETLWDVVVPRTPTMGVDVWFEAVRTSGVLANDEAVACALILALHREILETASQLLETPQFTCEPETFDAQGGVQTWKRIPRDGVTSKLRDDLEPSEIPLMKWKSSISLETRRVASMARAHADAALAAMVDASCAHIEHIETSAREASTRAFVRSTRESREAHANLGIVLTTAPSGLLRLSKGVSSD